MYNLELTKKAEDKLNNLKINDLSNFEILVKNINQLKNDITINVKNIGNNIFRKRVGRWRILFTVKNNLLTIWIIDLEKDTKKDYKKWKDYIASKM